MIIIYDSYQIEVEESEIFPDTWNATVSLEKDPKFYFWDCSVSQEPFGKCILKAMEECDINSESYG
ncbi:hypothetical protein [Iningainema tapete]|uniref:Uncharacterized protein n=1 Tax=Iningainema tapete BLCC-T55 TaxID=2748662 RepID=A0A8J7BW19_9CYAN|nr:hypothetical protein [Iningainema tapete]MBD2770972.1 hypothetical protein [Iningainema tapete BLCC-T55]